MKRHVLIKILTPLFIGGIVTIIYLSQFSVRIQAQRQAAPALQIDVQGPANAQVGSILNYTFTVHHTPNSDLSPVGEVDIKTTLGTKTILVEGDRNSDTFLDGTETWVYTSTYTVQPTDTEPFINAVTVVGKGQTNNIISVTKPWPTLIEYHPGLILTKSGPITASVGDIILYVIEVKHSVTSDGSTVNNLVVEDSLAGKVTYISGDLNTDSKLQLGETWSYAANYVIKPTDPITLTNTATVSGLDSDNETITDSDSHTLTTFRPNMPPTVSNVHIEPLKVNIKTNLTVKYEYHDREGDLEKNSQINWYENGQLRPELNNTLVVSASYLTVGAKWQASVSPNDGFNYGEIVTSNVITVVHANFFYLPVIIKPKTQPATITPTSTGTVTTPTPTVTATPTSTRTPTSTSTPECVSTVSFVDEFSNSGSGWVRGSYEEANYSYFGGEYEVQPKLDVSIRSASPFGAFSRYKITTVAEIDESFFRPEYGLVFGIKGNIDHRVRVATSFYHFGIDTDDEPKYQFRRWDESIPSWISIVEWTPSTAIHSGSTPNALMVECNETSISLYANKIQLGVFPLDSRYPCNGDVGITTVPNSNNVEASVYFDSFKVCGVRDSSSRSVSIPLTRTIVSK